jgi:hypothetical protein
LLFFFVVVFCISSLIIGRRKQRHHRVDVAHASSLSLFSLSLSLSVCVSDRVVALPSLSCFLRISKIFPEPLVETLSTLGLAKSALSLEISERAPLSSLHAQTPRARIREGFKICTKKRNGFSFFFRVLSFRPFCSRMFF